MQLIHQNGERLFVTSLDISNHFGKQHKVVLRAIENLDCSAEFGRRNFAPSSYNNSQNKAQPMYEITRDGFVFLCMGFTGQQAALWKERYIDAFNRMEAALRATPPAVRAAAPDLALAREVGNLKDMVAAQNQVIIGLYQRIDTAQRGHLRALSSLGNIHKRRAAQEAKALVLELAARGVPRDEIALRTGKTLNHIRQIIFRASREGHFSADITPRQGDLGLEAQP